MALPHDPRVHHEMTIAIAGFATADFIVTVSDARLSHGQLIPAIDNAAMKNRKIGTRWGMMFAASDATAFDPVVRSVIDALSINPADLSLNEVRQVVQIAYEAEFDERFFRQHLARFRYQDVADFRKHGYNELGKELYGQYADALARHDLGLELLVYGFDEHRNRHLFEVLNPGKFVSQNLRGFTAIGSGAWMAVAALNRKPLSAGLPETIWRLLEAKFSSETAPEVGKKTHVIVMNSSGKYASMYQSEIEKIRDAWDEQMKRPEPEELIHYIANTSISKAMYDGPA